MSRRTALALALLLAVAFGLRWAVVASFDDATPRGDQLIYLRDAFAIADGETYEGTRGPGYAAFLALCRATLGETPTALRLGNILVALALIAGLWSLGVELFGRRVGWVVAWLVAIHPRYVAFPLYFFSEGLYAALVVWASFALARGLRDGRAGPLAVGGALLGAGCLTRESLLYFVPVAAALVSGLRWRVARPRSWRAGAWVLGAALVIVAPWTARNWATHGRFLPVGCSSGIPLFMGNYEADSRREVSDRMQTLYAEYEATADGNQVEADRLMRGTAWQVIADRQPTWIFEKTLAHVPLLFQPSVTAPRLWELSTDRQADGARRLYASAFLPLHAAVLLLACLGIAHWRLSAPELVPLVFLAFSSAMHIVANAGHSRFQVGYEWVALLAAAVAVERHWPKATPRRWIAALLLAVMVVAQAAVADRWGRMATFATESTLDDSAG